MVGKQEVMRFLPVLPVIQPLRQSDTAQQVFHTRIGAQRVEFWMKIKPDDKPGISLLVGFFQRCERKVPFSQAGVDGSKIDS